MKNKIYIIISLFVIFTTCFTVQVKAQSLEAIEFPALPQITKPISEMSIVELQAKIQEILVVVQQLQAVLNNLRIQETIAKIPSDYVFTQDLIYGQSNTDIKYLQIILNLDSATRLASSGAGSPGQETSYFGPRTKQAILSFQTKHQQDIPLPLNVQGVGYVEAKTRNKLNQLLEQYRSVVVVVPAPTTPTTPTTPTIKGICGDSIVQTPNDKGIHEVCDGAKLQGQTCVGLGYASGTLSCSSDCITFDTSQCFTAADGDGGGGGGGEITPASSQPIVPVCGNNTDKVCPSGCNHSKDIDCTYCGDNILQGPNSEGVLEVCDTNVLNNQTCITKGFPGGTLKCSNTCLTFDTSSCTSPPPPNQAPVLNAIGNKSVQENQQLTFTISATDPDNDPLTYSTTGLPSGAVFSNSTRTFAWTPSYTQSGTYNVTLTVSDSKLTDTEAITITVNNVNRAPILNAISNKSVTQNNTLTFTISTTDPDGDTLTYSATNLPSGAAFNASTRTFAWTPTTTGTYSNITFVVSDGSLTDSETITITVSAAAPPPTPPTSCNTDSDCASRGPGFICNSSNICSWKPPIGIPKPEFGIEETYRMYDNVGNRNPNLTYTQNAEGGYYTHYVDNTHPNATDSGNPYGTASIPRLTYGELELPAGSVVEIHGGPYVPIPWSVNIIAQGDPTHPVFFRGFDNQNKPDIQQLFYVRDSTYLIIENLYFAPLKHLWFDYYPVDHVAVRSSEFDGQSIEKTGSVIFVAGPATSPAHDIVIYNNHIHHQGDSTLYEAGDRVGVKFEGYTNNLWVVDNHMHHIQGDSFGGGNVGTDNMHHLYVGRNVMHDNKENAIDVKESADVIISQNTMYGFYPSASSNGDALRVNDEGLQDNIWILFNEIYDSAYCINPSGADAPPYIIGNILHDCERAIWRGTNAVVNNVIYNISTGIKEGNNVINNIIYKASNYHLDGGSNVHYNLLWQEGGPILLSGVTCTDCIEADPLFVDALNNDFHLQSTSPAIDNGTLSDVYQTFFDLYGIDIRKDIEGRTRPQGSGWDIGAYEYAGAVPPQQCSGTDTSCGVYPSCQNCNSSDGCSGTTYRDYRCSGTSCVYTEYPNDSRCAPAPECTSGQTRSCNTGLQGICSSGTQTCQSNGTWGTCVQNNQPTTEICNDSLDNDCDGTTDCSDSDCSADPACVSTIPTDYISWWKFDGNANDEKGVNNGTIQGNPQFVSGVQGQALSFDGNGDYVGIPFTADEGIASLAISFWVKAPGTPAGNQYPVAHYASSADYVWYFRFNNTNDLYFIVRNSAGSTAFQEFSDSSLEDGIWHHVVGTYDGINVRLYMDGVISPDILRSLTGSTDVANQQLTFGCLEEGVGYFNGLIDNVMIFNRALTASEIQNIYNSQKLAMRVEPGKYEFFLKNLASILSVIQEILEKLKSLF